MVLPIPTTTHPHTHTQPTQKSLHPPPLPPLPIPRIQIQIQLLHPHPLLKRTQLRRQHTQPKPRIQPRTTTPLLLPRTNTQPPFPRMMSRDIPHPPSKRHTRPSFWAQNWTVDIGVPGHESFTHISLAAFTDGSADVPSACGACAAGSAEVPDGDFRPAVVGVVGVCCVVA